MKKTGGIFHDRFIVLDYGTDDERVFLCGASSKDAGAKITSIVEDYGVSKYAPVIATPVENPTLILPQQRGVKVLKLNRGNKVRLLWKKTNPHVLIATNNIQ